jgi:hypothetical protein
LKRKRAFFKSLQAAAAWYVIVHEQELKMGSILAFSIRRFNDDFIDGYHIKAECFSVGLDSNLRFVGEISIINDWQ